MATTKKKVSKKVNVDKSRTTSVRLSMAAFETIEKNGIVLSKLVEKELEKVAKEGVCPVCSSKIKFK